MIGKNKLEKIGDNLGGIFLCNICLQTLVTFKDVWSNLISSQIIYRWLKKHIETFISSKKDNFFCDTLFLFYKCNKAQCTKFTSIGTTKEWQPSVAIDVVS